MDPLLTSVAEQFGTPCYVYDLDFLSARAQALKAAFGGRFALSYAVKSNPNPELLRQMRDIADTLDISSGGELVRALQAGWSPDLISFTGPAKTDKELSASVDARIGHMIVESLQEAVRLDGFAAAAGIVQGILPRISPATMPSGFGVNMAGKPCQFGIDEEEADETIEQILRLKHLRIDGFHIYSGTQCLKAGAIAENYLNFIRIFKTLSQKHGIDSKKFVFGSGLGVPYYKGDTPLDLKTIADAVMPSLDELPSADLFLEVGRYLVGEAGRYLTRVVNVKKSRGTLVAICDGGMNHNSAACGHMGSVIPRNYRMSVPSAEPDAPLESYEIYGPLCTSIDRLARNEQLPALQPGSLIALECSGAYGMSASPMRFISHAPAKEVTMQTVNGSLQLLDVSEYSS